MSVLGLPSQYYESLEKYILYKTMPKTQKNMKSQNAKGSKLASHPVCRFDRVRMVGSVLESLFAAADLT